MNAQESSYFLSRAETHIALAEKARHERAAKAHYHLAAAYLDRVHRNGSATIQVRADAA